MTTATQALALSQIVVDPALQPRLDGLNADHVRALQDTPDAWPPLLVVPHGNTYMTCYPKSAQSLCETSACQTA